jgi:arylsulfatase A-like enzyme
MQNLSKLLLVSFCLLLTFLPASFTLRAAMPDILVVLADQWNPRYLSWENPQVRTPHLDQIARQGMIFDRCYVTSPVCMPSRISLMTGLYPHNHGHALWGNASNSYYMRPEDAPMFREIRAAGYATAQIGKTHWTSGNAWRETYPNPEDYFVALGLDKVIDVSGPPDSDKGNSAYNKHLRDKGLLKLVADDIKQRLLSGEFEPRPSVVGLEDYHDYFVTQQAIDHIRSQPADQPMCLFVSLHAPHPPLDAPGPFASMYQPEELKLPANVPEVFNREKQSIDQARLKKMLANYLGKISLVDDCIGQLQQAMQARGTWENTLFILTCDHGEMMGAHGALTKGRFYEESVRVPLVMRWPSKFQSGRTTALAQMMDVYPTILEAIGQKLTPQRFAQSQFPVAAGQTKFIRQLCISEIGNPGEPSIRWMATDSRFKYWTDEVGEALFDLQQDSFEMNDLAADPKHLADLNTMRHRLLEHLRFTQVNYGAGSKSKVQRLREAEAKSK